MTDDEVHKLFQSFLNRIDTKLVKDYRDFAVAYCERIKAEQPIDVTDHGVQADYLEERMRADIRLEVASKCLVALITDPRRSATIAGYASDAVSYADALLKELGR